MQANNKSNNNNGRYWRRRRETLEPKAKDQPERQIVIKSSESWSAKVSYWAQVGSLAVLVFGYFYTVRPVFQNQLLQEQAAKLTLENRVAQEKLQTTLDAQRVADVRLREMQVEISSSSLTQKQLQDQLATSLADFQKKETELKTELTKETESSVTRTRILNIALERELTVLTGAITLAAVGDDESTILREYMLSYSNYYESDFDGGFIAKHMESWPDPYKIVSDSLSTVVTASKQKVPMPDEIIKKYEERVVAKSGSFRCDIPKFDELKSGFLVDMNAVETIVDKSLKDELARQKRELKFPYFYLKDNPEWDNEYKSAKRLEERGKVVVKYREPLTAARRACLAKTIEFMEAVTKSTESDQ